MADIWEDGSWSPCFSRLFNNWEVEEVQSLHHTIRVKRVHHNQEDMMLLKETKDGCFSVKCFYGVLDRSISVLFPLCII